MFAMLEMIQMFVRVCVCVMPLNDNMFTNIKYLLFSSTAVWYEGFVVTCCAQCGILVINNSFIAGM